jgi:hypothetical protein
MKTVFRIGIALYLLALADMLFVSTGAITLANFIALCIVLLLIVFVTAIA